MLENKRLHIIRLAAISTAILAIFVTTTIAEQKKDLTAAKKLNLNFIPTNALAVLAIKPAGLLAQDVMEPFRKQLLALVGDLTLEDILGVKLSDIETMRCFYIAPASGNPEQVSAVYIIQTKKTSDQNAVMKLLAEFEELSYKKNSYFQAIDKKNPIPVQVMLPDDYTYIMTVGKNSMPDLIDAMQRGKNHKWKKYWDIVDNNYLAAIVDVQEARKMYQKIYSEMSPEDLLASVAAMGIPQSSLIMFENIEVISMRATFFNRFAIRATFYQNKNGDVVKKAIDDVVDQWKVLFQKEGNGIDPQKPEVINNLYGHLYSKLLRSIRTARQAENVKMMIVFPEGLIGMYLSGVEE